MAPRNDRTRRARASEDYYRDRRRRPPQDRRHDRHAQSLRDTPSFSETTNTLSEDSLAKLNALNEKVDWEQQDRRQARRREEHEDRYEEERRERARRAARREQRRRKEHDDHNHYREKSGGRRVVSGPLLEDGKYEPHEYRSRRRREPFSDPSQYEDEDARKRRKRKWICRSKACSTCVNKTKSA